MVTVELLRTIAVTVVGAAVKVFCFVVSFFAQRYEDGKRTVWFTVTVPVTVTVAASAVLLTKSLASISAALLARISANLFLMLA